VPARPAAVQLAVETLLIASDETFLGRLSRWAGLQARRLAVWLGGAMVLAIVSTQVIEPDGARLRISVFLAGISGIGLSILVVPPLVALWWTRLVYGLHPADGPSRLYYASSGLMVVGCVVQTLTIPAQWWLSLFS
jgi:hypothetical protein